MLQTDAGDKEKEKRKKRDRTQHRKGEPGSPVPSPLQKQKSEILLGLLTCHASAPIMAKVGRQQ